MDAVKFLEELNRMCKTYSDCNNCPIGGAHHVACMFSNAINSKVEYAEFSKDVARVEKWSFEHQQKTRLQDFLEKHPNAPLNNGAPFSLPWFAGYCKAFSCRECELATIGTPSCWNLPLEE